MFLKPQFFDIFGVGAFAFVTFWAFWAIKKRKPLPKWVSYTLLLIGVFGLTIDPVIVMTNYF